MSSEELSFEEQAPPRILVVDDDVRLLESMSRLLSLHHYQIDLAAGGMDAIEKLDSADYDLVLLDLAMPYVSGHDVMRYMKDKGIKAVIIVVSGVDSHDLMTQALREGAYDYVKKPYQPEELIATIKNAIGKCRLDFLHEVMKKQLEQSELLHCFIVESSPDIIFALDDQNCFSFVNSRVETLLGYKQEALLGLPVSTLLESGQSEKITCFFKNLAAYPNRLLNTEIFLRTNKDNPCPGNVRCFELSAFAIEQIENFQELPQHHRYYVTARDITSRKEAEAVIAYQANHDLLTQLPNRSRFCDRLDHIIALSTRHGHKFAVIFIDLDHFKIVNDSLGHVTGDMLIKEVSQRILSSIRRSDTLSRYGGDEFTLLLSEIKDAETATQVAEKILASLRVPFYIFGHEIIVGASIGIALFPEHGNNSEDLIKYADLAMYRAKSQGRNCYSFFSDDLIGNITRRLRLERELRLALTRDEFILYYQRQTNPKTGELTGVEALLRWNHPEMGQITPDKFIAVAEECKIIVEMDLKSLARACADIRKCHDKGMEGLRLSVNFSPLAFETGTFVEDVIDILNKAGFPPSLLDLEITENLLISNRHDTVNQLRRLHETGIHISIDDFGTGYSCLSYLQQLPINTLKIDKSFITDINSKNENNGIIDAILAMARGLKLKVIAEGVENQKQLNYLRLSGCDCVQGFLFGRPSPLENIVSM